MLNGSTSKGMIIVPSLARPQAAPVTPRADIWYHQLPQLYIIMCARLCVVADSCWMCFCLSKHTLLPKYRLSVYVFCIVVTAHILVADEGNGLVLVPVHPVLGPGSEAFYDYLYWPVLLMIYSSLMRLTWITHPWLSTIISTLTYNLWFSLLPLPCMWIQAERYASFPCVIIKIAQLKWNDNLNNQREVKRGRVLEMKSRLESSSMFKLVLGWVSYVSPNVSDSPFSSERSSPRSEIMSALQAM